MCTSPDNYGDRANLMWSGMISHNGTCGVGREEDWVSHYMEHEVSALYNVPHGAGLSVIFIAWLRWMVNHNPKKIVQFAVRVWNVDNIISDVEIAKEGVERLKDFWQSIGLPVTFEQLGVSNPDIHLLVSQLHKNKGEKIG